MTRKRPEKRDDMIYTQEEYERVRKIFTTGHNPENPGARLNLGDIGDIRVQMTHPTPNPDGTPRGAIIKLRHVEDYVQRKGFKVGYEYEEPKRKAGRPKKDKTLKDIEEETGIKGANLAEAPSGANV